MFMYQHKTTQYRLLSHWYIPSILCKSYSMVFYFLTDHLTTDFLYVGDWTHHRIYQVSLINQSVRALDSGFIQKPNAVVFDVVRKQILWSDTALGLIQKVNIDGSGYSVLGNIGM